MNELVNIINTYFNKDVEISVYNNGKIDEKEINNMIQNMVQFERPDILSIYDDKIIGIEHFEFDSYKNNKKGSDYKIKDNDIHKKFDNYMKEELAKRESVTLSDVITSSSTLENYYNNFRACFVNHYQKIDNYIDSIKFKIDTEGKDLNIWFFAEDVTPLGSYFLDDERKIHLLHPFYEKTMIYLLEKSEKISGIMLGTYAMKEHKVVFIYNNKESIKRLKDNVRKIEEKDFLSFEPHTTGFATLIPKNE